jgi:hypothetical protein
MMKSRSHKKEFLRLASVVVAFGLGGGCDCFFRAQGSVVECGTTTPVAAEYQVRVDRGINGRQYLNPNIRFLDQAGNFQVTVGQPCESWVSLLFRKDGFDPLEVQMKGSPKEPQQLCMKRTGAQ